MRVNKKHTFHLKPIVGLLAVVLMPTQLSALVISEDFTGKTTLNNWLMPLPGDGVTRPTSSAHPKVVFNHACLTAGDGVRSPTATTAGSPPKCTVGNNDSDGQGALRLTPVRTFHVGGIVSDFSFPTNDGVDITFTTYTWGGSGADGMTFFLADADKPATLGASGGSIGYSCSNGNLVFSGVDGGYFGIGMDEYGNYVNHRDNTNTGAITPSHPENRTVNAIGIRGAGSINYSYMSNPDRFLQDVYNRMQWGIVPNDVKNRWRARWHTATPPASMTEPQQQEIANIMRGICRSGVYTIERDFVPAGRNPVRLSDAYPADNPARSQLKLYNYKYFQHAVLTQPMATSGSHIRSRSQARPIQYRIRITEDGKASVWYSYNAGTYQPVMLDYDVVAQNGPLPRAFRFGFMGATGGSHNNHEVTCFKAAPASQSEGDASINLPDGKLVSDSHLFYSSYNPLYWTGQVLAYRLLYSASTDTYAFDTKATWDAACKLNGGNQLHKSSICDSTRSSVSAQDRHTRVFWTWNGSQGVSLDWNNLSSTQQNSLEMPSDAAGVAQQRLEYLKGDISQEQIRAGFGLFRARKSLLADVINSSPTWVGAPANSKYQQRWQDYRYPAAAMPENSGQSYTAFSNTHKQRGHVVYAGSNDGFLHGFRAGSNKADGSFDSANNDGAEVLAYMPSAVLQRIIHKTNDSLNFSHPQYAHNFYNDAAPAVGDVFYGGSWHTWLMSGLGAGGNAIYALDVTDPAEFTSSNTNAGARVVGEWSYDSVNPIWKSLGNTYGTPVFGRFHDGNWGAVFGNGWCSSVDQANGNCTANDGPAGIYVMSIDNVTGQPSFTFISTGETGTLDNPNGIAYVTPVDLDRDRIYDYAYAGDLKGNVWRFNLSSDNPTTWANSQPQKIFTTRTQQPITTKIGVAIDAKTNRDPVLSFGTGQRKEGYLGAGVTYANAVQSVYGLRDRSVKNFPSGGGNTTPEIVHTRLLKQSFGNDDSLTDHKIDWNIHDGWYLDLGSITQPPPDGSIEYEQAIYNIHIEKDKYLILNTYINGSSPTLSCSSTKSTGYTYPLKVDSGGVIKEFTTNNPNSAGYRLKQDLSGGSGIIYGPNNQALQVGKTTDGSPFVSKVFFPNEQNIRRISWREIF